MVFLCNLVRCLILVLAYTIRYRQFLDYFLKTKDFSGPTSNAVMCIFAIKKNRYVCNSSIFYGFVFLDKNFDPIHSRPISINFSDLWNPHPSKYNFCIHNLCFPQSLTPTNFTSFQHCLSIQFHFIWRPIYFLFICLSILITRYWDKS